MFSAKFLALGAVVAGTLALLPAVALFTVGPLAERRMCRPVCAFYDFATGVFGVHAGNVGLGLLFVAIGVTLIVVGVRRWPRKQRSNAV
jgi:hypothetical protein